MDHGPSRATVLLEGRPSSALPVGAGVKAAWVEVDSTAAPAISAQTATLDALRDWASQPPIGDVPEGLRRLRAELASLLTSGDVALPPPEWARTSSVCPPPAAHRPHHARATPSRAHPLQVMPPSLTDPPVPPNGCTLLYLQPFYTSQVGIQPAAAARSRVVVPAPSFGHQPSPVSVGASFIQGEPSLPDCHCPRAHSVCCRAARAVHVPSTLCTCAHAGVADTCCSARSATRHRPACLRFTLATATAVHSGIPPRDAMSLPLSR